MGGVMKTCVVKFIRKGDAGDPAVTYRIQLLSATAHVDTDKVMRGAITWNVIKEVSGVETYINSSTGTHQCKLSSASSWSTAGSSGNNFNDNGLINGVSFSTAGSPTHLLIRFVLGGNVKCTLAVGISVDGVKGDFKSIVFKRTNTTPVSTPSGGTYDSPVPSGWSDSIPSGQAKLWASECTFYGAGGSSGWSTPRQMTDTDTYDVEFSDVDQNPGTPSTNPSNWFDPDTDTSKDFTQMLWRAERECINGTWGSWTVVRIKGETGARSFKSTCFIRTNNSSLAVPTGGSFSSPIPTSTVYDSASGTYLSWSDGIPSGQAKLWAVTRIFTSDGQSPQQSAWSTPRQMTDTDTYDVEFSDVDQNPGTPSTNPSNWFDPDTDTSKDFTQMLWRAERECINGTWGSWTVVRIKGETGDKGDKGDEGDSAPAATASPDKITIPCYNGGTVKSQTVKSVTFYLKVGTNDATVTNVTSGTKPTGVSVQGVHSNAVTITVGTDATASGMANGVTFTVTGTYGGKTYSAKVTVALIGTIEGPQGPQGGTGGQGPRGYRGPALRGPQDWAQMEVGYQFYKGDANTQEPYEDFVVYNGSYYKCKKTHTKTASNYPGSTTDTNNGYWELSSKVGIVASNIFFGEHGYFGDAIISGEWMISTNGTIDGTDYNNRATYQGVLAYSLFNPNNPLGSTNKKYESTTAKTFTASDSTKAWTTLTLESGKVYYLSVKGYGGSSSGYYVRLRNTSTGTTYAPVLINSTSEVTRTGYIKPTATGTYSLEIYNPNGISGTVSSITLTQKDFAPNYCVDLLTGKTYQCDAYVKGQIVATGGNITGTLTVGTYGANTNSIRIVPDSTNPSIVGYVGTTEVFRLGTSVNYDGSANPTVKVGRSFLRESGLYILDADGSNCRAYGTRFIVERVVSSLHYPFSINITSNKKVVLRANGKAMWPTTKSEVGWGGVYVDGDVLKVNMDG